MKDYGEEGLGEKTWDHLDFEYYSMEQQRKEEGTNSAIQEEGGI